MKDRWGYAAVKGKCGVVWEGIPIMTHSCWDIILEFLTEKKGTSPFCGNQFCRFIKGKKQVGTLVLIKMILPMVMMEICSMIFNKKFKFPNLNCKAQSSDK